MYTKGDFHIHSTASDGSLTPKEIVLYAKKTGIDIIAVTDHNSTGGVGEAVEAGKEYGVSVIPGVELSTRYKGNSIHVLGYFKNTNYNDSDFQKVLSYIKDHNFKGARYAIGNFMNINISEDRLSVSEGINLLRVFEASVVLAHPVRIHKAYLTEILSLPFDGLEAKYPQNRHIDTLYFIAVALSKFSFYTAGSDFHTDLRSDNKHSTIGKPYLDGTEIEKFLNHSGSAVLS